MKYLIDENTLTDIADEIREKTGKTEEIKVKDMATEISTISGGGGVDFPKITAWKNLCQDYRYDYFSYDDFRKLLENPEGDISYFLTTNSASCCELPGFDFEEFCDFVNSKDFSNVTNASYVFSCRIINFTSKKTLNFDFSNCTNLSYFFSSSINAFTSYCVDIDFHGTTSNVTNFSSCINRAGTLVENIFNINMDRATSINTAFGSSTNKGIKRLTFDGSFGGLSNTATLTLPLNYTALTHNTFMETVNSLSPNESGKTRILKVYSTVYNALTEADIDLIEEKGYSISK